MMTTRTNPGRTRRTRVLATGVLAYLALGAAQAAWEVTDRETHTRLGEISGRLGEGNANQKLTQIHDAQRLGSASSSGELEKEPTGEEKLDHGEISPVAVGSAQRCPNADASGIAAQQNQICQEIVRTEQAKYTFSLRMYELAETRHKRLEELERERAGLGEYDQGKLQDNSNRLLALLALMQIDQQQQATYMDAYDARLAYLGAARDALTRQALDGVKSSGGRSGGGSPGGGTGGAGGPGGGGGATGDGGDSGSGGGGGVVGGVVGAGVLAMALEAAKTRKTYDPEDRFHR